MLRLLIWSCLLNLVLGNVCPQRKAKCQVCSPAENQLPFFKETQTGPIGDLTTTTGRKLDKNTANRALGEILLRNDRLMEGLSGLVREPTLPRVVHAKGAGAMGTFTVTHDVSDIMDIEPFSKIGKTTPCTVRFSTTAFDAGSADTVRDNRGFAVKFFTQDGVLDILSLTTENFVLKDPIKFPTFTHATKRNPQTHRPDDNMLWDFISLNPESIAFFLRIFSDIGIPCSFSKLPGFSVHTFNFCNSQKQTYFGRFRWVPYAGIEGLSSKDAVRIAGENPDYHTQQLYDMIANGTYPSWTLQVQPLSLDDVREAEIDVFDPTLILDSKKYPPRSIGKLVLNRNPVNFHVDIESLAFCVRNLIPGITAMVQMFEARIFVYLDAQNQRLGVNHNKNRANNPEPYAKTYTYYRDGVEPLGDNGNNAPNYYPNSFFGPIPVAEPKCPELNMTISLDPGPTNFGQASDYYESLSRDEKGRLISNIGDSLSKAKKDIQDRTIALFTTINKNLGTKVAENVASKSKPCPGCDVGSKPTNKTSKKIKD